DLKPGNVMLTKSGVKLLDFGLAKLAAPPSGPISGFSMLPTTPKGSNLTAEGTILGTFQYMAPEQLEGKEADARTDIFALGTTVYEMATGKKAFEGRSQASLIGAILKDEPATISTIQPMSPPALDRVVKTCLAKDADERWQSAHDVAKELKWIAEGSGVGVGAPAIPVSRRKSRERLTWTVAAVLFAFLAVRLLSDLLRASPEQRVTRFNLAPPSGESLQQELSSSPDGRWLAMAAWGKD